MVMGGLGGMGFRDRVPCRGLLLLAPRASLALPGFSVILRLSVIPGLWVL
jgi:hypothetical protein